MAAYRFYNPAPIFFDLLGVSPLRQGNLFFYDIGTTTPKNTWSDDGLTVLNPNPIELDGGGRASVNIFLDGDYTVRCEDRLGSLIWTRDVISGSTAGQTIPALEVDEFLTNDGANLLWRAIRQLPDATGSTGSIPVTNGSGPDGYTLQTIASLFPSVISFPTGGVKLSNGSTAYMIQFGSGTVGNSGTSVGFGAINFATPFSNPPRVFVQPTSRANPSGGMPSWLVNTVTTTGAQLIIDTNTFNDMSQTLTFEFFAIGTVDP